MARCPHCKEFIDEVVGETIKVDHEYGEFLGTAYCCPTEGCHMILSVEVHPESGAVVLVAKIKILKFLCRAKTPLA